MKLSCLSDLKIAEENSSPSSDHNDDDLNDDDLLSPVLSSHQASSHQASSTGQSLVAEVIGSH